MKSIFKNLLAIFVVFGLSLFSAPFFKTILNVFYDFYLNNASFSEVINTHFNKTKIYMGDANSELLVKWYVSLKVLNTYKIPIDAVNVQITDNANGTYDSQFITDSNGEMNYIY